MSSRQEKNGAIHHILGGIVAGVSGTIFGAFELLGLDRGVYSF